MRRGHRKAHRSAWVVLLVVLPLIFGAALILRPDPSDLPPPEQLDAPGAAQGEGGQ